jgi:acid phosphatase
MESMPAACGTTDTSLYVQKHNPFVHYDDIVKDRTRCANHVVPFTQFDTDLRAGTLPSYVWISPNMCNDMHNCSVATGDTWLSRVVPKIINSPVFAHSVIFILWDEGTTTIGGGGRIPALVISPWTPAGFRWAGAADHYDLLRTIEDAWGLPPLGQTASATAMKEFFPGR